MAEVLAEGLNRRERTRLRQLEGVIDGGMTEAGNALREIRDSRLYRETHPTFEGYCHERWGWSHRHANRTIEAAEVAKVLGPMGPNRTNERQARELAPLLDQPEQLREAWEAASSNGKPTAAGVREAVIRIRQKDDETPIVYANCAFCGISVIVGSTQVARRIRDGWVFPRNDGGTNSVAEAVYEDDYACKACVRTKGPMTEENLRRSKGIVLDLRSDGLLSSVRRSEDAMKAIVLVRDNGPLNEEAHAEVISSLAWIKKEAAKTAALLGRERK